MRAAPQRRLMRACRAGNFRAPVILETAVGHDEESLWPTVVGRIKHDDTMDYKNTLNLPRTEFPMKADLVAREPARLEKWQR